MLLVVEYARNVLGMRDAEHAESSPDATTHVITPLTCSLFGQRTARSGWMQPRLQAMR